MSTDLETHRATCTSHIGTLRQAGQSLADQGMREDVPTGSTPRKRSWTLADKWSLTDRETVLNNYRKRGTPSSSSEAISMGDLPSPTAEADGTIDDADDSEMDESGTEDERDLDDQDDTIRIASPLQLDVKSLASSTSSISSETAVSTTSSVLKKPPSIRKSGLPTRGTLTERSTNLMGLRVTTRRTQR